jgi:aryl-alcohol dehydrogenase-like predicted oxidoreductase
MRELGRTGQKLTCIGMGGGRFHLIPLEEATAMIRRAYDLGINYFDMARGYYKGHAEEIYGSVIPEFRKDIFLTSKSGQRTREGAEADLENSLKTMRTDHLDLWQMHSVGTKADIEKILGPGGALEAFVAAKKAGKVRFFGFTGHADPDINLQLLRSYDGFDTMLMPLHVSDTVFLSFSENVVPVAQEHGIGILGMKVFGSAYLLRTFSVEDCLSYTLNLPVTAVYYAGPTGRRRTDRAEVQAALAGSGAGVARPGPCRLRCDGWAGGSRARRGVLEEEELMPCRGRPRS